jgi:hypothetical protein
MNENDTDRDTDTQHYTDDENELEYDDIDDNDDNDDDNSVEDADINNENNANNDDDELNYIDTEWIDELKHSIQDFKEFYKQPCQKIMLCLMFINKDNHMISVSKQEYSLHTPNIFTKQDLHVFLKQFNQTTPFKQEQYPLYSISRFNIFIEPSDILYEACLSAEDEEKRNRQNCLSYFTTFQLPLNADISFQDTIPLFQQTNTLFLCFKEIQPKPIQSPITTSISIKKKQNRKTKRVKFNLQPKIKRENKNENTNQAQSQPQSLSKRFTRKKHSSQ